MFNFLLVLFGFGDKVLDDTALLRGQLMQVCCCNHHQLVNFFKGGECRIKAKQVINSPVITYSHKVDSYVGLRVITTYHDNKGLIIHVTGAGSLH